MNLILQGPIISNVSYENTSKNSEKINLKGFDCIQNLELILKNYRKHFEYVILTTWECDQPKKNTLKYISEKFRVDIQYLLKPNNPKGFSGYIHDTRYIQYFALEKALSYISEKTSFKNNITIKMRLDQFIYFEPLFDLIKLKENQLDKKLIFPYALSGDLFSVSDFFVIGKNSLMLTYYRYLIKTIDMPSGSHSAHVDQVQKYLDLITYKTNSNDSFTRFYVVVGSDNLSKKLIPINLKSIFLWQKILKENFILTNKGWHEKSFWRGEKMKLAEEKIYDEDLEIRDVFLAKMTKKWKRRVVSNNIFSKYLFSRLPFYKRNYFFNNLNFKIIYNFRRLLTKL